MTGNHVQTQSVPTRSALLGMSAAALGARQGEWPTWLHDLELEIRVDNPGRIHRDFHTINPRPEARRFIDRIWIAAGQRGTAPESFTPDAEKGTSIVRRSYLAGAEFTAKLSHARVERLASAFARPGFSPYLGRKAFAPTFPFLLGIGGEGLLDHAPSRAGGPAAVHILDGRDTSYPDRSVEVIPLSLTDRLAWWSAHTRIPARNANLTSVREQSFSARGAVLPRGTGDVAVDHATR